MTDRPLFHSYGGSVYQSDGANYTQFPSNLLGVTPWSRGFQAFVKALLTAFNGQLKTDVQREDLRKIMIDQTDDPKLKHRYKYMRLQRISEWYAKARDELKMITRRRLEKSSDWEMEFVKPFKHQLEQPAPAKAASKRFPPGEIEEGELVIELMKQRGYRPEIDEKCDGGIRWNRIEGAEYKPITDKTHVLKHGPVIKAILLAGPRPARE